MDLLIAGIVLFLLFVATYGQRRTWVTLGSTALTIVLVAGIAFLSSAEKSNAVREGLDKLAAALPSGWDRRALDLANAVEQVSLASAAVRERAAARPPEPILATSMWSISDWFDWGAWSAGSSRSDAAVVPDQEAAQEPEPVRAQQPPAPVSDTANTPIQWLLDAPSPAANEPFAVSGANLSDQPMKLVRAELKPDNGAEKLTLTLDVEGGDGAGSGVVPPGARFSLKTNELTASEAEQLGGAILSVAYVQAGRRKSSIMYLTQDTLAAGTAAN